MGILFRSLKRIWFSLIQGNSKVSGRTGLTGGHKDKSQLHSVQHTFRVPARLWATTGCPGRPTASRHLLKALPAVSSATAKPLPGGSFPVLNLLTSHLFFLFETIRRCDLDIIFQRKKPDSKNPCSLQLELQLSLTSKAQNSTRIKTKIPLRLKSWHSKNVALLKVSEAVWEIPLCFGCYFCDLFVCFLYYF